MAKPQPLPGAPRPTHEDGWLILGHKYGSVDKLSGPYVFSGGWWNREIQRDYYFAETRRGAIAWVYYDRVETHEWFCKDGSNTRGNEFKVQSSSFVINVAVVTINA
jgi:hypothetical protein